MGTEQVKRSSEAVDELSTLLHRLKKQMELWGDEGSAEIIADLERKAGAAELTLGFCGHFSAGKSSMINRLCGSPVLPSGPVPTSANIVSIRHGKPRVRVHSRNGEDLAVQLPSEGIPAQLAEMCRSGAEYSAIEVWTESPLLGSYGVLLDTPGVDSTDEGHQAATQSALHLADIVFYVMDYNHVQSENNLAFAKNLSDSGKPLYLIVNQIDKHREDEISIKLYQRQLENAFQGWGVQYEGLLFTSLKFQDHGLNQWDSLISLIGRLLEQRQPLLQFSLLRSLQHTAELSVQAFREQQEEERERLLGLLADAPEAVEQELQSLSEANARLELLPEQARTGLRSRVDALLGNTNLMPADVREAAGSYAESVSPGFRTGLLSTAARREKERRSRLETWHGGLSQELSAQLEWHLIQEVRGWGEQLGLWSEEAESNLKQGFPAVSQDWLAAAVKPGSGSAGEALLNLCRSVAAEIKSGYRRAALDLGERLLAGLPPLLEAQRAELTRREQALSGQARAAAALAALDRAAAARAQALTALLPPRRPLTPGLLPAVRATPRAPAPAGGAALEARPQRAAGQAPAAAGPAAGTALPAGGRRRLNKAAAALDAAAGLLRSEPAMASAARSLAARAEDLRRGRFTLALFGAFSAGKSSFANALLGEEVLPVSPHPATAAVGRILAPEGDFRHGSAAVTMKSPEEVWEDITHSFGVLQLGTPQRQSWIAALEALPLRGIHPSALPHAGFLRAAAVGWAEAEPRLGTVRTVDLEEYRGLVAEESRACFVKGIDLYYGCPLTESGIVLVDTPGADSLHARHTGVTFGYMKDADAICFVTYYNHAFSKADRGLLAQLGRIKDSFALDKMFFILNASDLASGEEELQQVKDHVLQNLRAAGLRAPRIYALSSLLALEGKTQQKQDSFASSGFIQFEQTLWAFAGEELPRLSLNAAKESLAAVRRRAEEWQQLASRQAGEREAGMRQLQERRSLAEQRLALLASEQRPARDLRQEGKELVYHVRQRLGFAFGRWFQESFHPSVLREQGGSLKDVFSACGAELWRTAQRELEQELWATTLRLEAAGRRLVQEATSAAAAELSIPEEELELLEKSGTAWASPASLECVLPPPEMSALWNVFRNPRHFFEGPGRDQLKTALEPLLKEATAQAAALQEEPLLDFYAAQAASAQAQAAEQLQELLSEQEQALSGLLKGGDSAEHWADLGGQLQQLETSFDDIVDK